MEISLAALLVLFAIAVGTGFVLVFTAGLGAGFRSSGLDLAPGWRIRCTTCGRSRRAAEAGVVRLGAVGTKRTLGKCSNCNALRWVAIERAADDEMYYEGDKHRTPAKPAANSPAAPPYHRPARPRVEYR